MTDPTRRRGHPATGGRILAAGLSAGAAIALVAAMANAAHPDSSSGGSVEPITVRVVLADGRRVDSTVVPPPTLAQASPEVSASGSSHES